MSLEKKIEELKSIFTFKYTSEPGDHFICVKTEIPKYTKGIILITYGLILDMDPDPLNSKVWELKLVYLDFPPVYKTIFLHESQFTGKEIFVKDKTKYFITSIDLHEEISIPNQSIQYSNKIIKFKKPSPKI